MSPTQSQDYSRLGVRKETQVLVLNLLGLESNTVQLFCFTSLVRLWLVVCVTGQILRELAGAGGFGWI